MVGGLTPEQRRAVEGLVGRGVLSSEQAAAVLAEIEAARTPRPSAGSGTWEVLGYIGGALMLGGAGLLLAMSWEDLGRVVRVTTLVAVTLVLAAGGLLIAGGPGKLPAPARAPATPRSRIVAVLFALGSGTTAMTVGSSLDAFVSPGASDAVVVTAASLAAALLGYLVLPSGVGLTVTGVFSVGFVVAGADTWFDASVLPVAVGLVVLGLVWAGLALGGVLPQRHLGLGGGAAIAVAGAQWPLSSESPAWGYTVTLVLAVACFAVFLLRRAQVLLFFGVLGVTLAVPEAVWDWTGGALGGPVIVLIVGAVLLATGALGLHLRRTTSEHDSRGSAPW